MIAITGGSGLLGRELQKLIPDALYPCHMELDITSPASIESWFGRNPCDTVIHCAAFTSPPRCDSSPLQTLNTNIMGTCNLVKYALTHNCKIIYISTEYVYSGGEGLYSEVDPMLPVNRYGWSKLGGECAIHMLPSDKFCIIRCAFGPKEFPYEKAPSDQFSSRETVDIIAGKIKFLLDKNAIGVYNIGGWRRSVYQYATDISPDKYVAKCSRHDLGFNVPKDASLDNTKFRKLEEDNES